MSTAEIEPIIVPEDDGSCHDEEQKIIPTATVYKIESPDTDKIYIGSTSNNINSRFSKHINNYKRFTEDKEHRVNSCYELLNNFDNCKISVIVQMNNVTKQEVQEIEREYILENRDICVNKNRPGSSTERFYCEICNKEMSYKNYKYNHQQSVKHQKNKILNEKLKNVEELKNNILEMNKMINKENEILDEKYKLLDEDL